MDDLAIGYLNKREQDAANQRAAAITGGFTEGQTPETPFKGTEGLSFGEQAAQVLKSLEAGGYNVEAMPNSVLELLGGAARAVGLETIGGAVEKVGKEGRQFWQGKAQKVGLNPEVFAGEFHQNPSITRAASDIAQGLPSLVAAIVPSIVAGPEAGAALLSMGTGAEQYGQAKERGEGDATAIARAGVSMLANFALERYGLDAIMKQGSGAIVKKVLDSATKEGGTEALQQVSDNLISSFGRDNAEKWYSGVLDAAIGGAGSGGAAGGIVDLTGRKGEASKTGEPPATPPTPPIPEGAAKVETPTEGAKPLTIFSPAEEIKAAPAKWKEQSIKAYNPEESKASYTQTGEGILNLGRIDADEEVKALMAGIPTPAEAEEKIVGFRQPGFDVIADAEANPLSVEDILARQPGDAVDTRTIYWARQHQANIFNQLYESMKEAKAAMDSGDVEAKNAAADKAAKLYTLALEVKARAAGATATTGRSLASFNMQISPDMSAEASQQSLDNLIDLFQGQKGIEGEGVTVSAPTLDDLINMVDQLKDPRKVQTLLESADSPGFKDMFLELWVNALLSGPRTHAVNLASTGANLLWQIGERAAAGMIPGSTVKMGESLALMRGLAENSTNAFRLVADAFRNEYQSGQSKIDESIRRSAISGRNVELAVGRATGGNYRPDLTNTITGKAIDYLGHVVRLPGTALFAADRLWQGLITSGEYRALAWRRAVDQAERTGQDAELLYSVLLKNVDPAMMAKAQKAAEVVTFTNELGATGRAVQRLSDSSLITKMILPFTKTPGNIMKEAVKRTPFALATPDFYAELRAGGARRDLAIAKLGLGSMAMTAIGYLVAQGLVSGGGPKDDKQIEAMRREGWQPYSIYVSDEVRDSLGLEGNWIQYNRLDPVGTVIGLGADASELLAAGQDEATAEKIAAAVVTSAARNMTSKSYLVGLSSFIDAVTDPTSGNAQKWLKNLAGTVVPTVAAQMAQTMDPVSRKAETMLDQIKKRTPGFSSDLPPILDRWGREVKMTGGIGPDIVSPFRLSKGEPNAVDTEILRLLKKGEEISGLGTYGAFDNINGVELTPKQAEEFQREAGRNAFDVLNGIISKNHAALAKVSGMDKADAKDAIAAYHNAESFEQAAIIEKILRQTKDAAKIKIMKANPNEEFSWMLREPSVDTLKGIDTSKLSYNQRVKVEAAIKALENEGGK